MIDNLKAISPLVAIRPPAGARQAKETESTQPQDSLDWNNHQEAGFQPSPPPIKATGLEPAEKAQVKAKGLGETARKVGLGAALAVTALAGMAGAASAQTLPAQAQVRVTQQSANGGAMTLADAVRAALPNRDQTPVRVSSVQQVVNQFEAGRQIYVVGNPQYQGQNFTSADYAKFEQVMKDHPNAYVVLIESSRDVKGDDYVLSRGIGNSAAFQSNVDERTGDKNGEVFMIYFKVTDQSFINRTGHDRGMFMRSEQLLDEAGVGEGNFVDRETLQNRDLFNTYVDGIKAGKDVPSALNGVLNQVDRGVTTYITNFVQGAQTQVDSARGALTGVQPKIDAFQHKHGDKGQLGHPDVASWRSRLDEAQTRINNRDFAGGLQIAKSVQSAIGSYEQAISSFENAPGVAEHAQLLINQAEQQLPGLENNGPAQAARRNIDDARAALVQFQASYDANNPDYQQHLSRATELSNSAVERVAASRSQTQSIKNIKIYVSAAVAAATLVTGIALNYYARKRKGEAEGELETQIGALGDKSKELIRIMNEEDYGDIAKYTGMTQKLANELIAGTAESLAHMGGGEKFIAEAKSLIAGKTVGQRFKNLLFKSNYDKAINLLTDPEQKLPYDLSDSSRINLESGSKAEGWRQNIVASVPAQPFEDSLQGILTQMEQHGVKNDQLVTTIQKKATEVGTYLNQVKGEAEQVQQKSLQLQDQGKEDGLFVAASVTKRLLPTVLGDETQPGLIAKGNEVKQSDPIRAWEEFGDTSRRMAQDGDQIVAVGQQGRTDLLPALATADAALQPHDVQTAWAHSKKDELSLALDRTGEKAVQAPVGEAVADIQKQMVALQSRVETVVEQDTERREVSPGLISDAESDVDTARKGLASALQSAGVFAGGSPDQVLREPDRDPSTQTDKSHKDWDAIKPNLDNGNIEQAGVHLQNIRQQTALAHQLVKESREAFNNYTTTAEERRSRRDNIEASIPKTYAGSLERIRSTYAASAQKLVADEVNQPTTSKVETVGDYLTQAGKQLDTSGSLNSQAQGNYERAYLLTSRDQLNDSDSQLKTAQANLDAITKAEKTLADHQKAAEAELSALTGRLGGTATKSNEGYVRNPAKSLVQQAQTGLQQAAAAVQAKPADPYAANQALAGVENLRSQAESTIASDHRAFTAANSAIDSASSAIRSAESEINSVSGKSWSTYVSDYGSVSHSVSYSDLSGARSYLSNAESELSQARSQMSGKDYEQAKSDADAAVSKARSAASEASSVESREHSQYRSMVASAEAEAARRRREREEAAHHHDSGGGGGGHSGGGGSGSTGGGW